MKKILISLITIAAVSTLAFSFTKAYFSDTAEVLGNSIETAYLEISWNENRSQWGNSMYFPVTLAPGENTSWVDDKGTPHDQRIRLEIADGSMVPDHFEIQFATTNFQDGYPDHGEESWRNLYTKSIEVTSLYNHTDGWQYHGLLGQIDDSLDGNSGFVSLYDLERSLIDDVTVGEELNSIGFVLKMSENAGNEFQGDSLDLEITVGAAQASGQSVL